jgi:phosphatidylethanolamine-binding protein (PEBP) family uncharacterized protein
MPFTNPPHRDLILENRGKSNEKSDPGDLGLPQMQIGGIPDSTKLFEISMYDHKFGFDHGEMRIVYDKSGAIARRRVAEITGPCPPPKEQGRYEITVKALDGNDGVVGIGRRERYYPE